MVLCSSASAGEIKAYFNQLESESYTDPYRNITRPGQDLEKVIVDTILSAKRSVSVAVQEVRLPKVAQALALQHKNGLDVRVVLENSYHNTLLTMGGDPDDDDTNEHEASKYIELFNLVDLNKDGVISLQEMNQRDAVHILKRNNVPLKDDTSDGSLGSGLMHHKFLVVDDKTVIVTTANFTLSGIHGDLLDANTTGNANSLIKIESPEMASVFNEEFFIMWGGENEESNPNFGVSKGYRGTSEFSVGSTGVKAQFSPTSRAHGWEASVNGLIGRTIEGAQSEVLMALFVFSDQNIANILEKKNESVSNFDIGLLIEPKFAYRNYSEMLDLWGVALLDENCKYEEGNRPWRAPIRRAGVPNITRGDLLHHKFAVVDRETVIVGSQNWSASANLQNDENIIVIKNKDIAEAYAREFLRLEKDSRKGPSRSLLNRIDRMTELCGQR